MKRITGSSSQSCAGLWDFAFPGKVDIDALNPAAVCFAEKMPVPGAYDALPAHAGKLGVGAYRKSVRVPAGRHARLVFGAVSGQCRVWVDGVFLCEHACGYAPFEVALPPAASEEREVVVFADNRFDFERAPLNLDYVDYYQYGGIIRDVALEIFPPQGSWIDRVQVTPDAGNDPGGGVTLGVELGGVPGVIAQIRWRFEGEAASASRPAGSGTGTRYAATVAKPRLWSPETPNLHTVRVDALDRGGCLVDSVEVRFGLRRIEARDGALLLNGEPVFLRGYNRHEWHPNFGPSTPVLQMAADLQILKGMGCNFIRGAHYPQDQTFLDLCDELGILVWEEMNGGVPKPNYITPKFLADHRRSLRAMVRASYNHPSVILWGFLNEAASDQAFTRPLYEEITGMLREMDPSRLITYASNKAGKDLHLDLVDVISLNLYPGWYHCDAIEEPLTTVSPVLRGHLDTYSTPEWRGKPLIISEVGAEALYGWRDAHHDYFTEAYQAALLERVCEELLSHPRCNGVCLWQFSDVRTWSGSRSLSRPRTFNNKGSFDEYRRPKAAVEIVGKLFRAAARERTPRDVAKGEVFPCDHPEGL